MCHSLARLLLLPILVAASCSSYESRYRYEPGLVENLVETTQDGRLARVLVRVNGVRRADTDAGTPAGVELRVRIENPGSRALQLPVGGLRLTTGDLETLPAAVLDAALPLTIDPGESLRVLALFPFPAGLAAPDLDLDVLDLAWSLEHDGQRLEGSASFERAPWQSYPRSWNRDSWYFCGYHGRSHAWLGHAGCAPWFPQLYY